MVKTETPARRVDRETGRAYWLMVLPAFLVYALVMGFPIVLSIVLSLSNYDGGRMFGGQPWGFVGFAQYHKILADPYFWSALKNNMYIVGVSVLGQLPLGFVLAYIIYRRLVRWPDFWQGVLYVPNIISVIVVGILWQTIFSPYGPLADFINGINRNDFVHRLASVVPVGPVAITDDLVRRIVDAVGPAGIASANLANPVPDLRNLLASLGPLDQKGLLDAAANLFAPKWTADFLSVPDVAMIPILFVVLWMYTGFYLILFLANMQKIDTQIVESARIDGANEGQIMWHIILPALSGTIVNSAILAIAGSLSGGFALVFSMTGGGPSRITNILSIYMYDSAFRGAPNFPLANAIALVMVLISFGLIAVTKLLENRFGGKEE